VEYIGVGRFRHPWYLRGRILLGGREVWIFCLHFDWSDRDVRAQQITQLIADALTRDYCIIMGDFNDYPDDESLLHGLCAGEPLKNSNKNVIFDQLYNLCYPIHEMGEEGSHKFGGKWGMLDQLIVSGALLHPGESTYTSPEMMNICKESFLLKESATGPSPKRSFLGTFFAYGFSDHLPVFVDLIIRNEE
jgi:hypothetical protein